MATSAYTFANSNNKVYDLTVQTDQMSTNYNAIY